MGTIKILGQKRIFSDVIDLEAKKHWPTLTIKTVSYNIYYQIIMWYVQHYQCNCIPVICITQFSTSGQGNSSPTTEPQHSINLCVDIHEILKSFPAPPYYRQLRHGLVSHNRINELIACRSQSGVHDYSTAICALCGNWVWFNKPLAYSIKLCYSYRCTYICNMTNCFHTDAYWAYGYDTSSFIFVKNRVAN